VPDASRAASNRKTTRSAERSEAKLAGCVGRLSELVAQDCMKLHAVNVQLCKGKENRSTRHPLGPDSHCTRDYRLLQLCVLRTRRNNRTYSSGLDQDFEPLCR
jgi:hypothetical protein